MSISPKPIKLTPAQFVSQWIGAEHKFQVNVHNFEVNAFMYDVETALEMKEIFLQDQRESTQIFLKNWVRRPWRQKAAESVVRLLAPLL